MFLVLYEGNPPITDRFPLQRASIAENVYISWRHLDICFNFTTSLVWCQFLATSIPPQWWPYVMVSTSGTTAQQTDASNDELIYCSLVTPYGAIDLGQHWLRYADDTKPLPEPEPVLTNHQRGRMTFIGWQFRRRYLAHPSITKISLKIIYKKKSFKSPRGQWVK